MARGVLAFLFCFVVSVAYSGTVTGTGSGLPPNVQHTFLVPGSTYSSCTNTVTYSHQFSFATDANGYFLISEPAGSATSRGHVFSVPIYTFAADGGTYTFSGAASATVGSCQSGSADWQSWSWSISWEADPSPCSQPRLMVGVDLTLTLVPPDGYRLRSHTVVLKYGGAVKTITTPEAPDTLPISVPVQFVGDMPTHDTPIVLEVDGVPVWTYQFNCEDLTPEEGIVAQTSVQFAVGSGSTPGTDTTTTTTDPDGNTTTTTTTPPTPDDPQVVDGATGSGGGTVNGGASGGTGGSSGGGGPSTGGFGSTPPGGSITTTSKTNVAGGGTASGDMTKQDFYDAVKTGVTDAGKSGTFPMGGAWPGYSAPTDGDPDFDASAISSGAESLRGKVDSIGDSFDNLMQSAQGLAPSFGPVPSAVSSWVFPVPGAYFGTGSFTINLAAYSAAIQLFRNALLVMFAVLFYFAVVRYLRGALADLGR